MKRSVGLLVLIFFVLVLNLKTSWSSTGESFSPQKKIAFMADKTTLKSKDALAKIGCRPMIIAATGPISTADASKLGREMTIALGTYRFVRTDVGDPDGVLTVTRGGKEICIVEISLLSGIRFLPSKDMMALKFESGSGLDWQIFQLGEVEKGNPCVSLGLISNKDADEFERGLPALSTCR